MRSLDIKEIAVALISFLHINPTPPQPLLRVAFSVSRSSIFISAVKAGWMLHRRSASKGQSQCSLTAMMSHPQLVYVGFPTAKASTIPGGEIESGRGGVHSRGWVTGCSVLYLIGGRRAGSSSGIIRSP